MYILISDEILGSLQFVNNYKERYGNGPSFFEGSLEDAMKTAYTSKPAKDVSHKVSFLTI